MQQHDHIDGYQHVSNDVIARRNVELQAEVTAFEEALRVHPSPETLRRLEEARAELSYAQFKLGNANKPEVFVKINGNACTRCDSH